MTARERISGALGSDDLSEVPLEEVGDIDIVRACGMVGQSMPVGVALWRLKYAGDARELRAVLKGLRGLMVDKGWGGQDAQAIIERCVRHWLDDICKACQGRGFETVAGAPVLSNRACARCAGQGRLRLSETTAKAKWVEETIARLEREAASAIMKKLRTAMEL